MFYVGHKKLRDVSTLDELEEGRKKMPSVTYRRAHHVVSELQRTPAGAQALENSDYKEFGRLMYQSHESLQKYFEVSCDELDQLVELARSVDGVYGSRMTGAGFGKVIIGSLPPLIVVISFSRWLYSYSCEEICRTKMY